jgi:anthranilate/para-aminobenzoate synthase component II
MSLPLTHAEVVLPRAVIIDCYDSYTANLLTLLGRYPDKTLLERVVIIKQDQFSWYVFRPPAFGCLSLKVLVDRAPP